MIVCMVTLRVTAYETACDYGLVTPFLGMHVDGGDLSFMVGPRPSPRARAHTHTRARTHARTQSKRFLNVTRSIRLSAESESIDNFAVLLGQTSASTTLG